MRPDEELLIAAAGTAEGGPTLAIGGTAAFVEALLHTGRTVSWLPLDVRETGDAPDGITILPDPGTPLGADDRFAEVIFPASPERDLGRRWLVMARNHLAPGGRVILAGANATGIRSTIADGVSLFGTPFREDYRSKQRVATFVPDAQPVADPAWTTQPGIAEGTWDKVDLPLDGAALAIATLPGVFAGSRLDLGTELLLAHLDLEPGEHVLDVGCGAGAIGFTVWRRMGETGAVVMTDVNLLAVASVRETIRRAGMSSVRAVAGDVYDGLGAGERFDLIVSNPPFHQGKTVDLAMPQRLIGDAAQHLVPGGRLVIVANAFLPYERLLEERFRVVKELANTRRFKVLLAIRSR